MSKIHFIYVWKSQTVKMEKNSNGMLYRNGIKKFPNNMETQRTENNKSDPGLKKILPEVSQYRFQNILQSHSDKTSKIFICIKIKTAS